jgi:hypothetical protein
VSEQCPNGVQKVETEVSFVNGLVGALTWSLYTPIHAKVTCAARSSPGLATGHEIKSPVASFFFPSGSTPIRPVLPIPH